MTGQGRAGWRWLVGALLCALAGCGGSEPMPETLNRPPPLPQAASAPAAAPPAATAGSGEAMVPPARLKAVLIAGDNQEPAFDNAVDAMAGKLEDFGVPSGNIAVLKASASDKEAATVANLRAAFADLDRDTTAGCFVFVTSHGAPRRGLVMRRAHAFLSPKSLDYFLLNSACATRPTVVIASGCFSGIFASDPAMVAANRTILTAASADRPSFGCNAKLHYTFFDRCILDSLVPGVSWDRVMERTRSCVSAAEATLHVQPSNPQIWVGEAERGKLDFPR